MCLVQFWYESKGHISVDHRHGATGYMVSDAMLAWLARHLNGRVFETGTGSYMDLTRDYPLYFMDVVRREHAHIMAREDKARKTGWELARLPGEELEKLSSREANYKALEGDNFTGKFARFWERVGVPIEQEPKPWDAMACERCCLCRTPTRWWTTLSDRKPGEQVALCEGCALTATPATIPTKRAWCDKERALNPRPYWGRSPWTFQGKEPS